MASRFTQYGGAAGADLALREMVAERLMAEAEQRKIQQQQIETSMRAHQLRQGDERIGLEGRGLDLEEQRMKAPPPPKGPMSMSPGSSLVDPESGRIIASIPDRPEKPSGPMNLGPGAVIADPTTGRIIVRNPATAQRSPEDDLRTFEAKEQIKAKYGGSRPSLGAERQALAYFNRAQQATKDIGDMEEDIAKMGLAGQTRLQMAPNFLQTPENQRYRQAQRAFTEARLRKESGAAIPTAEYENDAKTYFAQPGDGPEQLEQKRQAREVVLNGLKFAAGKAYEEYYGEPNQSPARQQQGGAPGGVTIKAIRQVR